MQKSPLFCTECGSPVPAGQRFCTNCGATIGAGASDPTALSPNQPQASGANVAIPAQVPSTGPNLPDTNKPLAARPDSTGNDPYLTKSQASTPPPPPPVAATYNPYTASAPGGAQTYQQSNAPGYVPPPESDSYNKTPMPGTYTTVPPYARARKSHGCLITSIVLLLVLAAGIGGVVFWQQHNNHSNNGQTTNNGTPNSVGSTPHTGGSNGGTNGANGGSTEQLNLKVTYAGVNITITSVQFASSFTDDTSSNGQAGLVRVNFHEINPLTKNPGYGEESVLLLVLPDGSTVQSSRQLQFFSPDGNISRDNWADFPVSSQVTLSQLTLRFGTANENPMSIPLQPNADISKYQDKTSNPNVSFQYAGLNWTLKTASLSYSYQSHQATKGNLYVVLTLSAINNSSKEFISLPSSFMRLQTGDNMQAEDGDSTFPYDIASQATGAGTVGFLVPQDASSFTLIMLGPPNNTGQVTQNFQI